jgi:hypothetical protein
MCMLWAYPTRAAMQKPRLRIPQPRARRKPKFLAVSRRGVRRSILMNLNSSERKGVSTRALARISHGMGFRERETRQGVASLSAPPDNGKSRKLQLLVGERAIENLRWLLACAI